MVSLSNYQSPGVVSGSYIRKSERCDMPRRHRIDLKTQMAHRAGNYRKLLKLMPEWQKRSRFYLHCPLNSGKILKLILHITERRPYTLTLTVEQRMDEAPPVLSWLHSFSIRLYTDARSAEVVACGNRRLANWHPLAEQRRTLLMDRANYDHLLSEMLSFWRRGFTPIETPACPGRWLNWISGNITN